MPGAFIAAIICWTLGGLCHPPAILIAPPPAILELMMSLAAPATEPSAGTGATRRDADSTHRGMGNGDVERWRPLVAAHFDPGAVDRALCLIAAESGGNPAAYNTSSGASGLFQHLPKYWSERSTKAGWAGADIMDPTANVAVAGWLAETGGWTHWSAYNRGLCH